MRRRRAPRPLSEAIGSLQASLAPATLLGEVQRVWPAVAGEAIAREARPESERGGTVTVLCTGAAWAHELDLMAPILVQRLNAAVTRGEVQRLRCVTRRASRSRRT